MLKQGESGSEARGSRNTLQTSWDQVNEAGTYVARETGHLYRFTDESLVPGHSPVITIEASNGLTLVKLSDDPLCITQKARILAAQNNIQPNF